MRDAAPNVSIQFAALLVVAHETGHRGQSNRMLRSGDVDFENKPITWCGEHDKIGFEHVTPITYEAVRVLERLRREHGVIGDACLFPSPVDPSKPLCRRTLSKWWKATESEAGLAPVKGRGLHSLRRKFATELKPMPLRDLAHLGGWKCTNTVVMVYQQPDEETMREGLRKRATLKSVANSR